MQASVRAATVGTALVALSWLVGCGRPTTWTGARETSWSSGVPNAVPGIDEGSLSFVTLKAGPPDGLSFVVWSDLPNEAAGHGSATPAAALRRVLRGSSPRQRWASRGVPRKTADGKSGSLTIAGVDYDFAKGALFLVSTGAETPRVAQVTFDLSGFPKDGTLKEFARSSPQIRDFFEKHNKKRANNN